jgi:class 3 adenylate cyclase
MQPETRFAPVGEDRVAYQVVGDGPFDLVYCSGAWSHIDMRWEHPRLSNVLRRLAGFSRVIAFDRRGSGASDPLPFDELATWERGAEDMRAVLDATASRRAALYAFADAGPLGILFAATQPDRTAALVLNTTSARFLAAPDYPAGAGEDALNVISAITATWGTEDYVRAFLPTLADDDDFRRWYARYLRACASPRVVTSYFEHIMRADIRDAVSLVSCPTLVLHFEHAPIPVAQGRWLAEHIAGARFELLSGDQSQFFDERQERMITLIEEFLTGIGRGSEPDRLLATVLFTDIVGSTDRTVALGDRRWRELLDRHDATVRRHVLRVGGRLVKTTGDGAVAMFDGPGKAIRCALALTGDLRDAGIAIRAGLHTGEVELRGDDVGGIAVHIAARVMGEAGPGDVFVSRTVRDLLMGSPIRLTDRGTHALRGVPGDWQLFAAVGPYDPTR